MDFGGTGQEGHCSKWLFIRLGASPPTFLASRATAKALCTRRWKEWKIKRQRVLNPARAQNPTTLLGKKGENGGREGGKEGWRQVRKENHGVQIISGDRSSVGSSRGLPLVSTQLSVNTPASVLTTEHRPPFFSPPSNLTMDESLCYRWGYNLKNHKHNLPRTIQQGNGKTRTWTRKWLIPKIQALSTLLHWFSVAMPPGTGGRAIISH